MQRSQNILFWALSNLSHSRIGSPFLFNFQPGTNFRGGSSFFWTFGFGWLALVDGPGPSGSSAFLFFLLGLSLLFSPAFLPGWAPGVYLRSVNISWKCPNVKTYSPKINYPLWPPMCSVLWLAEILSRMSHFLISANHAASYKSFWHRKFWHKTVMAEEVDILLNLSE